MPMRSLGPLGMRSSNPRGLSNVDCIGILLKAPLHNSSLVNSMELQSQLPRHDGILCLSILMMALLSKDYHGSIHNNSVTIFMIYEKMNVDGVRYKTYVNLNDLQIKYVQIMNIAYN